jgi:hypothetical protein
MEDQLVGLEVAKLAEQKGFSIECKYEWVIPIARVHNGKTFVYEEREPKTREDAYNSSTDVNYKYLAKAPTQTTLQRWLREEYEIHIVPSVPGKDYNNEIKYQAFRIEVFNKIKYNGNEQPILTKEPGGGMYPYTIGNAKFTNTYYDLYEEALEVALLEGLKLKNYENIQK